MSGNWEKTYAELKAVDPQLYRKALQYSEGLALTYNFNHKVAAEVERAMVSLALEILTPKARP